MPAPSRDFPIVNSQSYTIPLSALSPLPWALSTGVSIVDAQNQLVATVQSPSNFSHDAPFLRDSPGYVQELAQQVDKLEEYVADLEAYSNQLEASALAVQPTSAATGMQQNPDLTT